MIKLLVSLSPQPHLIQLVQTVPSGEALRLNFDGMVSGIETTELNNALNNNAPIYDLSGRRVMNAVKGGLYIQNGRKFIVK